MLLRNLPQPEFPAEYLVPRLLVRKAARAAGVRACIDGKAALPCAAAGQETAAALQAERFWLYGQLNSRLRYQLGPVFVFFELKTLVNWLRIRRAKAPAETQLFLLTYSLLCRELHRILRNETDAGALARQLEECLCNRLSPQFSGIAALYIEKGLRIFEMRLYEIFFKSIGLSAPNAAVRSFLKTLVDQRNLLALAKGHYWQEKPPFLAGGHLTIHWKRTLAEPAQADRVLAGYHWQSGLPKEVSELSALEDFLHRRRGLALDRQARIGTVVERILHSLWQQEVHTGNMGLLAHGRLVGEELLGAKVIQ